MPDYSNLAGFRDQLKPDPVDRPEDRRKAALAVAWQAVTGNYSRDDVDTVLQMLGVIPTRPSEAATTPASRAAATRRAARARARAARSRSAATTDSGDTSQETA